MLQDYQRQIHLDFHTSPLIDDVAMDFDPLEFAKILKRAFVNSVTVFAKCHHGMSYYPTVIGTQHPALKGRDLLGEMLESLRNEDIRCPVYTTIAWEENIAHLYPQWRQMKRDGTYAIVETSADGKTVQPGGWKFNNWLHPEYQEYILHHLDEIVDAFAPDGIFLDIVFFHPRGGWSEESLKFRQQHNLLKEDAETQIKFESLALRQFTEKITKHLRKKQKEISIFYNSPNNFYISPEYGANVKTPYQTHFEIESLPSGFWGYHHFPRLARRLAFEGKSWLGMTGKFQKMWGDFGGLKSQYAIEYECFRSQCLGGGNSIGDQLHPRGVPDEETYQRIGKVYHQIRIAEDFFAGSEAIPEIGILSPNHISKDEATTKLSEEGAVMLMEELHYDCRVINDQADLNQFSLIILPDSVAISDALQEKLNDYYQGEGKLVISGDTGFNRLFWTLGKSRFESLGSTELYPTFWHTGNRNTIPVFQNRVIYTPGNNVAPPKKAEVLVDRILPYFNRTDGRFCSHFHSPHNKKDDAFPAVFRERSYIYFSDRIFFEYRKSGSGFIRDMLKWSIEELIGKPICADGLPPSIQVYPRRRNNDLILAMLRYLPVRKSIDIDIIDESLSFFGEVLRFTRAIDTISIFPSGKELDRNHDNEFILPDIKGRLLLEIKNYFNQ